MTAHYPEGTAHDPRAPWNAGTCDECSADTRPGEVLCDECEITALAEEAILGEPYTNGDAA